MSYLHKNRLWAGMLLFLAVSYNLYYIFLLRVEDTGYLIYLDVLLAASLLLLISMDAAGYYKRKARRKSLLESGHVIFRELKEENLEDENLEAAEHDVHVLEAQLREQFEKNCDLQDYIAKWCHEVKLPLSASLLMNEKIHDAALRMSQKQQLETIRQQLNGALLGCRVQGSLFDLYVRAVSLSDCVKTAIHNNQYFLIQNQFEILMQTEFIQTGQERPDCVQGELEQEQADCVQGEQGQERPDCAQGEPGKAGLAEIAPVLVYTDQSWFVYVLDQLIQNSMKYASEKPVLKFRLELKRSRGQEADDIRLIVWDNGQGILESDIRRIFERGYTGSSSHNGKYKSTGMGLYLAAQILERLGHTIAVESEYGVYTQFVIGISGSCADSP